MRRLFSFGCLIFIFTACTLCAGSIAMQGTVFLEVPSTMPVGGSASASTSSQEKEDSSSESSEVSSSSSSRHSKAESSSSIKSPSSSSSSQATPDPTPPPVEDIPNDMAPSPETNLYDTPIVGQPVATADQLVAAYYREKGNVPPKLTCTLEDLAQYYITYGRAENIRGDIAFFQAIHETGYFQFGGDVKPEQNNFCGLGATGNQNPGITFPDAATGVLAQIQHLKAYGTTVPPVLELVDPRYKYPAKGCAPTWVGLSGKWALPGYPYSYPSLESAVAAHADYGSGILKLYAQAVGISY